MGAATGPAGDVWMAGKDEVIRIGAEGKLLAATRIEGPGEITAIAVSGGWTRRDY